MLITSTRQLTAEQTSRISAFAERMAAVGADLYLFDAESQPLFSSNQNAADTDIETLKDFAGRIFDDGSAGLSSQLYRFDKSGIVLGVKLKHDTEDDLAVLIDCSQIAHTEQSQPNPVEHLCQMLSSFAEDYPVFVRSARQIEDISAELAHTYEELMLLYKMSSSMKMTRTDQSYLQLACDSLSELVAVEGIAIVLDKKIHNTRKLVLAAGAGVLPFIDDSNNTFFEVLFDRLNTELAQSKDALLDSDIETPFKYNWQNQLKSIIAVPLYANDKITGMMFATNRQGKPDFDSVDIKIFNSVANQCAIFIENNKLFNDLKELLVGSLKALTQSIDAKDQYTRGHSERVALISRWIAENYSQTEPFDDGQIDKIYLAGLLHDIGKIGISEAVLRKNGKLDDFEYAQIKAHPTIGARILSGIKQMSEVVAGALYHHERIDGSGYPQGVKGDQIPLAGKIVQIADTFDAMTSRRVYRDALDLSKALKEIEKNLGTQFDEKVGKVFLQSDINLLWRMLQDESIEEVHSGEFSDYGVAAVGALLK